MKTSMIALAALALGAVPAQAVVVTQAGDTGVSQGGATPNSDAAALAFDASNMPTFIETFEDGDADNFTLSNGTITNTPVGGGGSVFAFNTTSGGQYVVERAFGSSTIDFAFSTAISSFGFYLSGVQLDDLYVSFNDGSSQQFAINNYGSGAQFFGVSGLANPVTSFSIYRGSDIIGVDDLRFTFAGGVPEPSTWAMLILGFGVVGAATRRQKRSKAALAV